MFLKHFLLTFWKKLVCVHSLDDTNQTSFVFFLQYFWAYTLLLATVVICIEIVSRITPNFYFKGLHSFSGIMLVGLNIGVNTPRWVVFDTQNLGFSPQSQKWGPNTSESSNSELKRCEYPLGGGRTPKTNISVHFSQFHTDTHTLSEIWTMPVLSCMIRCPT